MEEKEILCNILSIFPEVFLPFITAYHSTKYDASTLVLDPIKTESFSKSRYSFLIAKLLYFRELLVATTSFSPWRISDKFTLLLCVSFSILFWAIEYDASSPIPQGIYWDFLPLFCKFLSQALHVGEYENLHVH